MDGQTLKQQTKIEISPHNSHSSRELSTIPRELPAFSLIVSRAHPQTLVLNTFVKKELSMNPFRSSSQQQQQHVPTRATQRIISNIQQTKRLRRNHTSTTARFGFRTLWTCLYGIVVIQCVGVVYLYAKVDGIFNLGRTTLDQLKLTTTLSSTSTTTAHSASSSVNQTKTTITTEQLEAWKTEQKLTPCVWYHNHHPDQGSSSSCHPQKDSSSSRMASLLSAPLRRLLRGASTTSFQEEDGSSSTIILRNTFTQDRFWCGHRVPANGGILQLSSSMMMNCRDAPRLYKKIPQVSGQNSPKIGFRMNVGDDPYFFDRSSSSKMTPFPNCSIPCYYAGEFSVLMRITFPNTPLTVIHSMEGPAYYEETRIKPFEWQNHVYYATTSFDSEVPLPYYSPAEYHIQTKPAFDFESVIPGASFLARNCDSQSGREQVVEALLQQQSSSSSTKFRVDSLSDCLHNAELPQGLPRDSMQNKTAIQERYMFHLAFENQKEPDYITEKVWGALAAGTIPVYLGAPNIKDHVPDERSIIVVDDFESVDALASYLDQVSKSRELYESFHAWRKRPLPTTFLEKYAFTQVHSKCRLCRWGYAQKHGFVWNQTRQDIQDLTIPRKACRNKLGLIGHPFKEYWLEQDGETLLSVESSATTKTCTIDTSNNGLEVEHGAIQRDIYYHDGVLDMVVAVNKPGKYLLRIETAIKDNELEILNKKTYRPKKKAATSDVTEESQQWWLDDGQSRMILLSQEPNKVTLSKEGTVDIPISSSDTGDSTNIFLFRFIMEEVDRFHKGAAYLPNYFGKLMAEVSSKMNSFIPSLLHTFQAISHFLKHRIYFIGRLRISSTHWRPTYWLHRSNTSLYQLRRSCAQSLRW